MGLNTTVVVLNDALGDIERDPKFGENLVKAIVRSDGKERETWGRYVPAFSYNAEGEVRGSFGNAAEIIETHHADGYAIVAVGGNTGVELGQCWYTGFPNTPEAKLKVLQQLADDIGYRLVKKSVKAA